MRTDKLTTEIKTIQRMSNDLAIKAICDVLLDIVTQVDKGKIGFGVKS